MRLRAELKGVLYLLAHDFQVPIRHLCWSVDLLKVELGTLGSDKVESNLTSLARNAQKLKTMLDSVVDYLQIKEPSDTLESANTREIVKAVCDSLQVSENSPKVKFVLKDLPILQSDSQFLRETFQQLIENSLQFSDPSRPLRVEIGATQDSSNHEWTFFVKDNGLGFNADQKESAFQLFHKLHLGDKYVGLGVGLSICKKQVESRGGKIWIETVLNTGTEVYFTVRSVSV